MKVPWLPKKKIAQAAAEVIAGYQTEVRRRVTPPIPVERIIERGLNLKLGFTDLRKKLKMRDVLGATYVNEALIYIDQSLLENHNEGRLYFTFAHEIGHWILHRKFVHQACRSRYGAAHILCRIKDAKKPVEWQADYFASCLLMPEKLVKNAFLNIYGPKPLILYNLKSSFKGPICFDPCVENWPMIAQKVKKEGRFCNVSKQALIIRLQELGLVKNETGLQMSWCKSHALT